MSLFESGVVRDSLFIQTKVDPRFGFAAQEEELEEAEDEDDGAGLFLEEHEEDGDYDEEDDEDGTTDEWARITAEPNARAAINQQDSLERSFTKFGSLNSNGVIMQENIFLQRQDNDESHSSVPSSNKPSLKPSFVQDDLNIDLSEEVYRKVAERLRQEN